MKSLRAAAVLLFLVASSCGPAKSPKVQGDAESTSVRFAIVSSGGFSVFQETLTEASTDGWAARVSSGRPDDANAGHWEKWAVDPAQVRAFAKGLEDGGFLTQEMIMLPPELTVADAPAETWRLRIGDKESIVQVQPGAGFVESFPAYMKAARKTLLSWTKGKPEANGDGPPPAELKVR